jgi:hypothetical protein
MKREEFIELINSMEEKNEGYGEDWYNEEPILTFLKEHNKDKEIYLSIIKFHPDILEYADKLLQNDFELMSMAVEEWGVSALKYASENLKDDRYIVNLAINYKQVSSKGGFVLEFVSETLRDDIEIVDKVMTWCLDPDSSEEFKYASENIKNNKEFIIDQLEFFTDHFDNPVFLQYISSELKNDTEFIKELIEINPNSIKYVSL